MASSNTSIPPFLKNFSLEGKTVLLTGGSGGIGLGVTSALAESGADVISLQLESEPTDEITAAVRKADKQIHIYNLDLSDLKSIQPVVEAVFSKHHPSILINCAGIYKASPTTEFPIDEIEKIIRINTTAGLILAREVVKFWLKDTQYSSSARKIVNFASISSFQGNFQNIAYVSSKGAVLNMTRGMSNEWASHGICVNSVAPGYTKSRMTVAKYNDASFNEQLFKKIPAGRWGEPKDIAAAVVYLSSPASDYVTGDCIVVDGGVLGGLP